MRIGHNFWMGGAYLSVLNMIEWGIPEKIFQMQFRRVDLASIGFPSQKLWPIHIFAQFLIVISMGGFGRGSSFKGRKYMLEKRIFWHKFVFAPGPRINFVQHEFPKKVFLRNTLMVTGVVCMACPAPKKTMSGRIWLRRNIVSKFWTNYLGFPFHGKGLLPPHTSPPPPVLPVSSRDTCCTPSVPPPPPPPPFPPFPPTFPPPPPSIPIAPQKLGDSRTTRVPPTTCHEIDNENYDKIELLGSQQKIRTIKEKKLTRAKKCDKMDRDRNGWNGSR